MKHTRFGILMIWTLALCHCGGGGNTSRDAGATGDSATSMDAMPMGDAGSSFDPSLTYPGEGDACEFSILCGDQQLCVDDACIRHERLDPATVSISDYRVFVSDTEHPSPLKTDAEINWFSTEEHYYSYLFPGHDGPALVFFTYSETHAQIAVYDDHFRSMEVDGMWVTALGYSPEGLLVAGGADNVTGRPRLVMFDHEDQLIFDEVTPASLDAEVQTAAGPGVGSAMLGVPQSFLWNEDHFEAAFAMGDATVDQLARAFPDIEFRTPRPPTQTIVGELTPAGDVSLKPLAGDLLVPGARAWLVQDGRGVGILLSHGLSATDPFAEVTVDWQNIETGDSEVIVSDVGSGAMYYQPSQSTWYYLYESQPVAADPMPCKLHAYRDGTEISLMGVEHAPSYGCALYEGVSLSSQFTIPYRVFREDDPFLTTYRAGAPPFSSMPPRMTLNRYSSDGTMEEVVLPFLSPRACVGSGFSGFPVSRFNIGFEVLVTAVNECDDLSMSSLAIVEGHLVTGG